MNILIDKKPYKLHFVSKTNFNIYENQLDDIYICDTKIISNSYENLSYNLLDEEGYLGFFISNLNNTIMYSSLIVDLNCSQIKDKLDSEESLDNAVEIVLLCSNSKNRIPGLTTEFFKNIITKVLPVYKSGIERILLYVAKGEINPTAISFYSKLGFRRIDRNIMEYVYNRVGGRIKRAKSKKNKSKKNKSKKNKSKKKVFRYYRYN
jgi:hypothetical protein